MTLFCSAQEFYSLYQDLSGRSLSLRMQVKGGSMYPFIKSGDWVDVVPLKDGARDVRRGEVVLYKKDDDLYMHRVIESKEDIFVAKGDMSFGHDGAIPKEMVLAKVVSVRRGGRTIDLCSGKNIFIGNLVASLSLLSQYPLLFARTILRCAASVLSGIQSLKAYRVAMRKIVKRDIAVRDAGPDDEEGLRDLYIMAGHDVKKGIADIGKEGSWLAARWGEKIVGGLTVTRHEDDPELWVIFGLEVKPLVRGLGIGERIVKEAIARAAKGGAKAIGLFVNKKAKAAIGLYNKLGFNVAEAPPEFNRPENELYLLYEIGG